MSTISGSQRANAQRPDVSLHLRSDADVRLWLLCRAKTHSNIAINHRKLSMWRNAFTQGRTLIL